VKSKCLTFSHSCILLHYSETISTINRVFFTEDTTSLSVQIIHSLSCLHMDTLKGLLCITESEHISYKQGSLHSNDNYNTDSNCRMSSSIVAPCGRLHSSKAVTTRLIGNVSYNTRTYQLLGNDHREPTTLTTSNLFCSTVGIIYNQLCTLIQFLFLLYDVKISFWTNITSFERYWRGFAENFSISYDPGAMKSFVKFHDSSLIIHFN
jgi:hypothetical protein